MLFTWEGLTLSGLIGILVVTLTTNCVSNNLRYLCCLLGKGLLFMDLFFPRSITID